VRNGYHGVDNGPVIWCEKTVALDFRVWVLSCMKRWRYHGRLFALEGISSLLQSRWASLLLYGLRVVLDWNLELSFVNKVLLSGFFFYISFSLFFFMHILAVCIGPFIYFSPLSFSV